MSNPITVGRSTPAGSLVEPSRPMRSGICHSRYVVLAIAVAWLIGWLTMWIDLLIFAGMLPAIVILIGVSIGIAMCLLGLPVQFSPGVVAGVLSFVPCIGTFASAISPVLPAAMISPDLVLPVVLVFSGIHVLESHLLIPLVQRRATHLPLALMLSAPATVFALAGAPGVTLATLEDRQPRAGWASALQAANRLDLEIFRNSIALTRNLHS